MRVLSNILIRRAQIRYVSQIFESITTLSQGSPRLRNRYHTSDVTQNAKYINNSSGRSLRQQNDERKEHGFFLEIDSLNNVTLNFFFNYTSKNKTRAMRERT